MLYAVLLAGPGGPGLYIQISSETSPIRVCQIFFFKEFRDNLDYHFYRSEWETCKIMGLSDDFLVRGI